MTDIDSHAIPPSNVREALDYLPYAHVCRVMLQMLALTGCRVKELDNMTAQNLLDNVIYWRLGKNQTGTRKETLPSSYVREITAYRATHRVSNKLFGIGAETFRRYFDRDIRPHLGQAWNEKVPALRSGIMSDTFRIGFKGFRKNYATLKFKELYDKWDDSSVALQFTSREMQHSTTRITACHYLMNFETLGLDRRDLRPQDFLTPHRQSRIMDWL